MKVLRYCPPQQLIPDLSPRPPPFVRKGVSIYVGLAAKNYKPRLCVWVALNFGGSPLAFALDWGALCRLSPWQPCIRRRVSREAGSAGEGRQSLSLNAPKIGTWPILAKVVWINSIWSLMPLYHNHRLSPWMAHRHSRAGEDLRPSSGLIDNWFLKPSQPRRSYQGDSAQWIDR